MNGPAFQSWFGVVTLAKSFTNFEKTVIILVIERYVGLRSGFKMNPNIFNTGMRSNGTLINNRGFAKS